MTWASIPKDAWNTEDVVPNDIRILLEVLPTTKAVNISGTAMSVMGRKDLETFEKLNCSWSQTQWLCGGHPIGQKWAIRAKGFYSVNGELHQGILDIVPKASSLYLVVHVPLEMYVAGVVKKEMGRAFPASALRAQAIAARSYAVAVAQERRSEGSPFDVYRTQKDQVYENAGAHDPKIFRDIKQTEGILLAIGRKILKAFYHSSSGGFLEKPSKVWPDLNKSLFEFAFHAKPDPYDAMSRGNNWSVNISPMMGALWPDVGPLKKVEIQKKSPSQRVLTIEVGGELGTLIMSGEQFRKRLGTTFIRSTLFNVTTAGPGWNIVGSGFGHGVGMSQMGARVMAKQGLDEGNILHFYYPGSRLIKAKN